MLWSSCEKDIDIQLHDAAPDLVVEGTIENGRPPVVILTRSLSYFSQIASPLLESSFVHNAVVTISDGSKTVRLREQARDTTNGNKMYFYTIGRQDGSTRLLGRRGGTYTLHITAGTDTCTAVTHIPAAGIVLDSLWWQPLASEEPEDSDKVVLVSRLIDPPETGDCVRYFTRRNSEPFYPGPASVADDEVTNGTIFDINLDRGTNRNTVKDADTGTDDGSFLQGDTVTVKFCDIDRATYNFWRTWEYAFSSNGNPFAAPIKITGNIQGALGYWGGYGVQYKTIIIQ